MDPVHISGINPFESIRHGAEPDPALLPAQAWLKATQIMSRPVRRIRESNSVSEAAAVMAAHRISCVVVTDGRGRASGILTERDILRRVVTKGHNPARMAVRNVMSRPLIGVPPSTDILSVVQRMKAGGIRRVAVLSKHRLAGMVTISDILAALSDVGSAEEISSVMTPHVVTIEPDKSIREAARLMALKGISCLVISLGKKAIGILTERDVVAHAADAGRLRVHDLMSSPVFLVPTSMPVFAACRLMKQRHIRHLVVQAGGRIAGIMTQTDLLRQFTLSLGSLDAANRRRLNLHSNPVFLADTGGRLIFASKAFGKLFEMKNLSDHYSRPALPPAGWVQPELRQRIFHETLEMNIVVMRDLRLQTRLGRGITVNLTVVPNFDAAGRHTGFQGILVDRTRQRQLERQILEISDTEMRRFGRELHDTLGQHLTGVALKSRRLEQLIRAGLARPREAAAITALVNGAIARTRNLSRLLFSVPSRPAKLGDILRQVVGECQSLYGMPIVVRIERADPVLSAAMSAHVYRIVQEAVTNAVRHSGARRIRILLASRNRRIVLTVDDDGRGMESRNSDGIGLGCELMKHRADLIGASLSIASLRSRGTRITCVLPAGTGFPHPS